MADRLVYLVRHGETAGESSRRYHGRNDVPLAELGREQVHRLGRCLCGVRFGALVHSPLCRARESASILLATLAVRPAVVEEEPRFAEVDFGDMEGMSDAEVAARWPDWHGRWKAGEATVYPGGEEITAFAARVASGFEDLLERHPEADLLVVAHRGVIKWGLVHLLGLSPAAAGAGAPGLGECVAVGADGRMNTLP